MSVRIAAAGIALILVTGCASLSGSDIPPCSDELQIARRDLSGATPFDPAHVIYETPDGELCRAR